MISAGFVAHVGSADWLRRAGVSVPQSVPLEISPLYALDADELTARVWPGRVVDSPLYLE